MSSWQPCAPQHLLDRIQIEDLLTLYYSALTTERSALMQYFTPDAILDLNGKIFNGHAEINSMYGDANALLDPEQMTGTYNMLMNNLRIQVDGEIATAHLLYTGLMCDDVRGPPRLVEMGREFDALVKLDGVWLINKRVIRSDSGMMEAYSHYLTPEEIRQPITG